MFIDALWQAAPIAHTVKCERGTVRRPSRVRALYIIAESRSTIACLALAGTADLPGH
jgi:hypothetical protein